MHENTGSEAAWAAEELRAARLGDVRRVKRVRAMLTRAVERPGGKLTQVITDKAELQGAYDLLEGGRVTASQLCESFAEGTWERVTDEPWIFVVVDGSSIAVTDLTHEKGLGTLGNLSHGSRGMKVITALGVDADGVTAGLVGQKWWARTKARKDSRDKRKRNSKRALPDKETQHWVDVIAQVAASAKAHGKRICFLVDREGDNRDLLLALQESGHDYIVRSAWDRLTAAVGEDEQKLRARLSRQAPAGSYAVEVKGAPKRTARTATMVVRAGRVTLAMRRRGETRSNVVHLSLNAAWAREEGTTPAGEKPLDWLLLTTRPVDTYGDAKTVVEGYTQRWRIEDFHRVWKSSACRVEETQLRSPEAVSVWGTILASVAGRIERLRLLARKRPSSPATIDFADHELRALMLLKRQQLAGKERLPSTTPSIELATLWVAELGGYTGKSSGGPPGAITIRRGLEILGPAARLLSELEAQRQ